MLLQALALKVVDAGQSGLLREDSCLRQSRKAVLREAIKTKTRYVSPLFALNLLPLHSHVAPACALPSQQHAQLNDTLQLLTDTDTEVAGQRRWERESKAVMSAGRAEAETSHMAAGVEGTGRLRRR